MRGRKISRMGTGAVLALVVCVGRCLAFLPGYEPEDGVDIAGFGAALSVASDEVTAPATVTFTAQNSLTGEQYSDFRWDFQTDGIIDLTTGDTNTASWTFTEPNPDSEYGAYEVTCYLKKADGTEAKIIKTIFVSAPASAPSISSLTATPTSGEAPLEVDLSATASGDSAIVKYLWDLDGDGLQDTVSTTGSISTILEGAGSYTLSVQVRDSAGLTASKKVGVTVNQPTQQQTTVTGSIQSPPNNSSFSQDYVFLSADTGDNVASVTFEYMTSGGSWQTIGSGTDNGLWTYDWNVDSLDAGEYSVRALLTGESGVTGSTPSVSISLVADSSSATVQNFIDSLTQNRTVKQTLQTGAPNRVNLAGVCNLLLQGSGFSGSGAIVMTELTGSGLALRGPRLRTRAGAGLSGVQLQTEGDVQLTSAVQLSLAIPSTTQLPASMLGVFHYDEATSSWEELESAVLSSDGEDFVAAVTELGTYVLSEIAGESAADIALSASSLSEGETIDITYSVGVRTEGELYIAAVVPDLLIAFFTSEGIVVDDMTPWDDSGVVAPFQEKTLMSLPYFDGIPSGDWVWGILISPDSGENTLDIETLTVTASDH